MILFTSGFPYSGKTTFVNALIEQLENKHVLHINPKDYYPDEFDGLNPDEKSEIAVTAWELSLERANKAICSLPNKALIVFDTCCSKSLHMQPLFINAKVRNHDIFLVFVNSNLNNRQQRANGINLNQFESRYAEDFQQTIPRLRPLANEFSIINNNDVELTELTKTANHIAEKIKLIRNK